MTGLRAAVTLEQILKHSPIERLVSLTSSPVQIWVAKQRPALVVRLPEASQPARACTQLLLGPEPTICSALISLKRRTPPVIIHSVSGPGPTEITQFGDSLVLLSPQQGSDIVPFHV